MSKPADNFFVTTSIPYINGEPHIGHTYELLTADVLARYARQQGKKVILSTGTDEHGGKIQEKALEQNKEVKQYADDVSERWRAIVPLVNMSSDRFIRTTDPGHEQRAALIWKALKPHIYKDKYSGWYCTGCESFVTESTAKNNSGTCPIHQRPYEKLEEDNYFFRLSGFSLKISEAISSGSFRIIPNSRKNEVLNMIKEGPDDISISRPKDKISWGIPVPDDGEQVMYVWFEALMNYITVLGYPEHEDFKNFWPADYQVIGKDIIRFHALIWPGMLLGLGIELPKNLYVHGFINIAGQKISKSLGNVIHPKQVIDVHGRDPLRYFMLRHTPSHGDGDFTWEKFEAAYNNELANELGNTVSRTAAMVKQYEKGIIGNIPPPEHDTASYHEYLLDCHFDKALDVVWEQIRGLNQYIDEQKPWEAARQKEPEHLSEMLAYMVSCLLEIAGLLTPFLPETAERINKIFASGVIKDEGTVIFPKTAKTQQPSGQEIK